MEGVGPVRGRPGPRGGPVNRYVRAPVCVCVDQRGEPTPLVDEEGSCSKCGYPVSDKEKMEC